MQSTKLKSIMAIALSSAMLFATAACGTSDKADAGTDSAKGSDAATITSYDVSSVEKDDTIAALLPESVTKDGKLTIGTNPSYAPAEFLDADARPRSLRHGSRPRHGQHLRSRDRNRLLQLRYDHSGHRLQVRSGIAAFTITKERMESVDFVSYFTAGMGYAVATGNPKNVDENDLCGLNVAVETGTVEEEAINKTAKQCKADGKKDITIQSSKQQTDATTAVVTGKADVFFADSPVVGYAIAQTDVSWNSSARTSMKCRTPSPSRRAIPRPPKPCRRPCKSSWTTAPTPRSSSTGASNPAHWTRPKSTRPSNSRQAVAKIRMGRTVCNTVAPFVH